MTDHTKKIFTCLDLEMNQPSGKIIQIGAVVGDVSSGKIIDKFMTYVNPDEPITEYITNLTGIKQIHIENAPNLNVAYELLKSFHMTNKSFVNPITWGGGDSVEIKQQLTEDEIALGSGWCFGRRWIDAKTIYQSYRIATKGQVQGGLGKALTRMGLKFEGRKHDALDDAANTFHIYCKLLDLFRSIDD